MDVNRCVHIGLRLYLLSFIVYLRYKMLLIQTCAMHQEINKSRHQKGLCMRISAIRSTMRMLFKQYSLKLMVKFTNLR